MHQEIARGPGSAAAKVRTLIDAACAFDASAFRDADADRGRPRCRDGSGDWQQQIDDVATSIELDAGTRAVAIRAPREPLERRPNETVDAGRFATEAHTCIPTSR